MQLLKKRYGSDIKGKKVAVLLGILGQPASDQRAKGFTDYMKKQGVDVVAQQPTGWAADKASAAMQNWLVKYPDLALVYALSDTLAVPAMNIAQRQRRLCTAKDDWSKNSSCVAFIVGRRDLRRRGRQGAAVTTRAVLARVVRLPLRQARLRGRQGARRCRRRRRSTRSSITPENATCSLKMINDMKAKLKTFPFGAPLQAIAAKTYHCKVLDKGM